jgi:hypothetical protein
VLAVSFCAHFESTELRGSAVFVSWLELTALLIPGKNDSEKVVTGTY